MHSEDDMPIANSLIVFREDFDDWAILFDPESGKTFGINHVAALIWKHLDGKHGIEDINQNIKETFSEIPNDLESQVQEFLDELVENGFAGYEV